MLEFNEADIIAAFTQAAAADTDAGDGMTLLEIADAAGLGVSAARAKMKRLVASGSWEVVRVPRHAMTGIIVPTWAYRPKKVTNDNDSPAD